jgi:hypothetical protein
MILFISTHPTSFSWPSRAGEAALSEPAFGSRASANGALNSIGIISKCYVTAEQWTIVSNGVKILF